MVKPVTIYQAQIALDKLSKGYHLRYMHTHPLKPDIEGNGWYITKDKDYPPLDVTKILKEDSIPGRDDLDVVQFVTTIDKNSITYINEMLFMEPPEGERIMMFNPEGTRQFVKWLQDNKIGL